MTNRFRKLIPTLNRILISKDIPAEKTKSGILLPQQDDKICIGTVEAVGPGTPSCLAA